MGDIADMHVEAYAAGLDPNEMDGADWADFLSDDEREPMTEADYADDLTIDIRCMVMTLASAGNEGETPAETLCRLFPKIGLAEAAAFFVVVESIGGFPHDD